jgi:hypothetical protein
VAPAGARAGRADRAGPEGAARAHQRQPAGGHARADRPRRRGAGRALQRVGRHRGLPRAHRLQQRAAAPSACRRWPATA